jgi:hypothetical protein
MGAMLPVHVGDIDQLQVCFVDQGGGLKGPAGLLASHEMPGDAPEFVIDARRQLLQRFLITVRPGAKKLGRLRAFGGGHIRRFSRLLNYSQPA